MRSSCSATAGELLQQVFGRPARLRLQLRRGPGRRPLARGARARRAGDARHPLHRLRPADPGRDARQGLCQDGSSQPPASRCRPAFCLQPTTDRDMLSQQIVTLAVHRHRQAGLGRLEQGHPRQVRRGQTRRCCAMPSIGLRRDHTPADPGRGIHRGRRADGRRRRQRSAAILGHHARRARTPDEQFVYSLEVKRDWQRQVRYECPAPLGAGSDGGVEQAALTRIRSARLPRRGPRRLPPARRRAYFLEVNPLPGLNPRRAIWSSWPICWA